MEHRKYLPFHAWKGHHLSEHYAKSDEVVLDVSNSLSGHYEKTDEYVLDVSNSLSEHYEKSDNVRTCRFK